MGEKNSMPTIEISEETLEKIKEQLGDNFQVEEVNSYNDLVGKKVFLRTVTYHLVGEVVKIVGDLMFLKKATWVADSRRFSEAVKNGFSNEAELEYVGDWFVNIKAITDGGIWKHKLTEKSQ